MLPVYDLTSYGWVVLAIAGLLIGVAKTALPGLATVAVAMFAAVLPAKESTAVMLVLLIVGDLLAVWTYRRDADWKALRSLVPPVLIGLIVGALVLNVISDDGMRQLIGAILLVLTAITLLLMLRGRRKDSAADAAEDSLASVAEEAETPEIAHTIDSAEQTAKQPTTLSGKVWPEPHRTLDLRFHRQFHHHGGQLGRPSDDNVLLGLRIRHGPVPWNSGLVLLCCQLS